MEACIYCGEVKPFTDEHVVSAGLGGDDKMWMLKGCVCGDCNTKVFSKLEASFLRASPVAIARLFHQEKTRGRGGETGTPIINTKHSFFDDRERGILFNQELRQGFEPIILPQIVLETSRLLSVCLPNADTGREFLEIIRTMANANPTLVEKVKDGIEVGYKTTSLTWDEEKEEFLPSATQIASRPPSVGDVVWVEKLVMPSTVVSDSRLTPRIFRRTQGQLVCVVFEVNDAPQFLTLIRQNMHSFTLSGSPLPTEVAAPEVHLTLEMRKDVHDRVMTKIGINLAAKIFGPDFIRRPEFAAAKEYARLGNGHVLKTTADKHPANLVLRPGDIPDVHIFCIAPGKAIDDDMRLLYVMASLYGGSFENFGLAELPKDTPELSEPIIIVVAYNENRIERYSMSDLSVRAEADGFGPVI